jgi:predicted Zn-dependent protease
VVPGGRDTVSLDLTWVALGGSIYQIAGMVGKVYTDEHYATFGAVAESFRRLSPGERARILETRLRVHDARGGESLAGFGQRTGNAWSPQRTAVANGLGESATLTEGQLLKIAVKQPYRGAQ